MMSHSGWYYSVGGTYNYFNVWYYTHLYDPDSNFISYMTLVNNKYNKFAANFNFGKIFAFTGNLFIDLYAGLGLTGYTYTSSVNKKWITPGEFAGGNGFEQEGVYVNAGIRVGWLWGCPR